MASKVFWKILFSVIFFSVASSWNRKICTKLILKKYTIYKYDPFMHMVVPQEKIIKNIIFVCCEGYSEISRRKEHPNCEAICKHSCGYGYCYRPNLCSCYYGYEPSNLDGVCKRKGVYNVVRTTVPPLLEKGSKVESSTWWKGMNRFSTVSYFKNNTSTPTKNFDFETAIPTKMQYTTFKVENVSEQVALKPSSSRAVDDFSRLKFPTTKQHKSFAVEYTTERIYLKQTPRALDDFPRTTFFSNKGVRFGSTNTTSKQHTSFTVIPTTGQIYFKPSSRDVDDFPRVKFITNGGSNRISKQQQHIFEVESSTKQIGEPTLKNTIHFTRKPHNSSELDSSTSRNNGDLLSKSINGFATKKPYEKFSPEISKGTFNAGESRGELISPATCIGGVCTCEMGYQLFKQRFCHRCADGYAFHFRTFSCKSLFKIDPRWFLLLLLIPVVIACIRIYIVIRRSRSSKSHRLKAHKAIFQEIRYFHSNNIEPVKRNYHGIDENIFKESEHVIQNDGNVLIVRV